ncbi:MAG: hypothetical protein A3C90_01935 [Candidatus Magasanikbacteria bacterium RIFCSPHIGHO2_02_FULL_51_14]|uniref:THIF-type NAD/FAD binding fold domain-containing protein n=1 Tax=Candidatus Magasanikbacteria bacterium RIFCSPHIGHO2_02_FULL_51_14 TaxID=1798683 RepID=A0A1F6MDX0_9BACT|nr:MAG: hypothetical protein A3C90_01935 [Candidatus Magasanikbacteria bacterium RIFCSPHIGHO2_02_FULL_51_14]
MDRPELIALDQVARLDQLRQTGVVFLDTYEEQLGELCAIRNPHLRGDISALKKVQQEFIQEYRDSRDDRKQGMWVYYPWLNKAIRFLEESLHDELRTARNKNLITAEEQEKFRDFSVAIAGLSVGSHAALSITLQGGGKYMRLADPDVISGSNLNRIRAGFDMVGMNKAVIAARGIYEMNPYAKLKLYTDGLEAMTLKNFLTEPNYVGIVIDEMDDLLLKFLIRKEARTLGIPVIMAADNGDGIVLTVERYDLERSLPLFGGVVEEMDESELTGLSPHEAVKIIADMIGPENVTRRMYASVAEIGKTLYSWPQLGGAAQLAGVALAYATRMIATGGPLKSGRTAVSLEKILSFNEL